MILLKWRTRNRAIVDKAPKPAGIMPKNLQSMVMIGIAVLMVLIMWLTGGGKKAATSPKPTVPATPPVIPTDTAQVQDFEKRIQSEQQAVRRAIVGWHRSAVGTGWAILQDMAAMMRLPWRGIQGG